MSEENKKERLYSVTFTARGLDIALQALAAQPYAKVAQLIAYIAKQRQEQDAAQKGDQP